jgi:hypothetical protein
MLPFNEIKIEEEIYIREFNSDLNESDLKWHWDNEDRIISSIENTDWRFQFDNKLPQIIEGEIFIKRGEWHRLIKGSGDLRLNVRKFSNIVN